MPDVTHDTREQVAQMLADAYGPVGSVAGMGEGSAFYEMADAVLAVFAERERLLRELPYQQGYMDAKRELRERIEALPRTLTAVGSSDDIGANVAVVLRDVLAAFDA